MTCKHEHITGFRFESGEPADLWACVECRNKFWPASDFEALRAELKYQTDNSANLQASIEVLHGRIRELEAEIASLRAALELIACPMRPDGTWNRDREACRQLAEKVLRDDLAK